MKNSLIGAIILFSITLNGIGLDIFVPSLPDIANYFNSSKELAQMSISAYLFGFGVTQIFIAILIDIYGRKTPYLIGIVSYIIAGIMILFIHKIEFLIICRFIQGASIGGCHLICRAIVTDKYKEQNLIKMLTYTSMAWALGPIIGPFIGSYLHHYFGWHGSFYFLVIYAVLCMIGFICLVPETLIHKQRFNYSIIINDHTTILTNKKFWLIAINLALIYSAGIVFNVIGPFLVEKIFQRSVIEFGYIALAMGISCFLGNLTNRILINVSTLHKTHYSILTMILSVLIMMIDNYYQLGLYLFIIPIIFIMFCTGMLWPAYFTKTVSIFSNHLNAKMFAIIGVIIMCSSGIYSSTIGALALSPQIGIILGIIIIIFGITILSRIIAKI